MTNKIQVPREDWVDLATALSLLDSVLFVTPDIEMAASVRNATERLRRVVEKLHIDDCKYGTPAPWGPTDGSAA